MFFKEIRECSRSLSGESYHSSVLYPSMPGETCDRMCERQIANVTINRAIAHAIYELSCRNCKTSDHHILLSQLWYILFYPKCDI